MKLWWAHTGYGVAIVAAESRDKARKLVASSIPDQSDQEWYLLQEGECYQPQELVVPDKPKAIVWVDCE